MVHLLTFGGLALQVRSNALSVMQVRLQELALLARLSVAGVRGVSRDQLVGYFWPETDERHALHSLSQALHRIRKELGIDDLFLGTRHLRLNPGLISSDVEEFETAAGNGDDERAVRLYAGPFLNGVFISAAPEFESWAQSERTRLSDTYARSLRRLATAADKAADHRAASMWWKRLAETDPLDSALALALVRSLAIAGDRAGALREARTHESLLRVELGQDPDASFRDCVEQLRKSVPSVTKSDRITEGVPRTISKSVEGASGLTVDELLARGRARMYSWTGSGFEEGIHYLEQALRLEPENAVAHVALAWLCIMSSQADQSGNIRQRGVDHCMRALAIDPMLSDARAALGWAKMLDELFEEGEALGREAVALDPGSHLNLIALGYIQISVGMKTGSRTKCIEAARACIAALVADPRDQAALMPLGCVYSLAADYDTAENLFRRALDAERLQGAEMRMIGSLSFLGHTQMRQQKLDEARKTLEYAANEYADAPQIFAPYINALTLCGLGDLERLAGRYDEAIAHYLRGRVLLDRMPGLVGSGYLVARLETRLASAYGRIHLRSEEARHAEAAREVTLSRRHYSFAWCWFVSEAELHYDWALYHATCAAKGKMLDDLRQAVSQGWAEVSLLDLDPAFAFYRSDPEVKAVFEQARRLQPLPELASS